MASKGDPQPPASPESVLSSIVPTSIRYSGKTQLGRKVRPISTPTLTPTPQLTFGVEIECLLLCNKIWQKENHGKLGFVNKGRAADYPPKPELLEHLSDKEIFELATDNTEFDPDNPEEVASANVNKVVWHYIWDSDPYHFAVANQHVQSVLRKINAAVRIENAETAIMMQMIGFESTEPTSWLISEDHSVSLDLSEQISLTREGWTVLSMELKSPILKYCPEALDHVHKVLTTLRHHFNNGINYRFFANETCGMHVHVGVQRRARINQLKMRNAGYPFYVLRNLFTIGALYEKQIDMAFPLDRAANTYAYPLSYWLRRTGDIYAGVDAIEERSTTRGIFFKLLLEPPKQKYGAYNITNLISGYRTIEFRQHHGSVDADEVCNWVMFVCGLMRVSYRAGKAGFPVSFLAQHKDADIGFPEMLDRLNMRDLADYYRRPGKLFEHKENLPWEIAPYVYDKDYQPDLSDADGSRRISIENLNNNQEEEASMGNSNYSHEQKRSWLADIHALDGAFTHGQGLLSKFLYLFRVIIALLWAFCRAVVVQGPFRVLRDLYLLLRLSYEEAERHGWYISMILDYFSLDTSRDDWVKVGL